MRIKFWVKAGGFEYVKHESFQQSVNFAEVKAMLEAFECMHKFSLVSKPSYFESGFEVVKLGRKNK